MMIGGSSFAGESPVTEISLSGAENILSGVIIIALRAEPEKNPSPSVYGVNFLQNKSY